MHDPDSNDPRGPSKIGGPSAPRSRSARDAGRVTGAPEAGEVERGDLVHSAQSIGETTGIDASTEIARIRDSLASGTIDVSSAREQLIDHVVRAQLPAGTSEGLVAQLREQVGQLLEHDPTLARLLRRP